MFFKRGSPDRHTHASIFKKMTKVILESEGIEPVPAEGLAFDPEKHEAISHEIAKNVKSGFIIEVVTQGYAIGDRIIRPSQVRVAK